MEFYAAALCSGSTQWKNRYKELNCDRNCKVTDLSKRKMAKERGTIEPNFHLRVSLSIIYFLGTWPPHASKYRILYRLYTVCSFIFLLGILLAAEIANVFANWGDMSKILAFATILMTNSIHASKVIVLLCRRERIQTLLDIANGPAFSRHDKKYQDLLMRYTWKGIFHHAAYQSFGAIAVFCWGITPITDLIAGRSRQLPMEGWYPYNVTRTPVFEITAAHQGIAIIIACFHNVALDTLVTGLITVACCQLAILERNIISIDNEKSMQSDKDQSFNLIEGKILSYRQLKQCAVHSNMIFNVTQMKVYIPAVLIGLVTYMCCMTYQIFIFCWHECTYSDSRVFEQLVLQY